jgi:hypothetical protein
MPPRRSTRVAAVAERVSSALSPLPPPIVLYIFSLLPADARARAACVCRGWCHVVSELSLWTRLDLSLSSGVRVRVTDAVLTGALAKARGQLAALDVSDCSAISFDTLLAGVRANRGALRELRVGVCDSDYCVGTQQTLDAAGAERLCRAAPQLTVCDAHLLGWSSAAGARRMLRNAPPFQPLRLRTLRIGFPENARDNTAVLQVAADVAAHASLQRMELHGAPLGTPVAMDAVVDVALARQLVSVRFWFCRLVPASVPALVRLLDGGTLTDLAFNQGHTLLDGESAALLGAALRANRTITSLRFTGELWQDAASGAAVVHALTGHSSMRMLRLTGSDALAVGAAASGALGALIAANAAALTELDLLQSHLDDAGLRPLFDALPANTHLRTLNVAGNDMSPEFARDVLLPAARANTSLRQLIVLLHPGRFEGDAHMREAQALVAARGDAVAAAQ